MRFSKTANGKTSAKTYQVIMLADSDYYLPVSVDDLPPSPDQKTLELEKLRNELRRRTNENPSARRQRLAHFKKQRDENGSLLVEISSAFTLDIVREEMKNGHEAYVLLATPRKRIGAMSRAAKVLSGMHGTIWLDKKRFHTIRAECTVTAPVPIYGVLAKVMPGTRIDFEMAPVSEEHWLITERSTTLSVSKFFWFKSTAITRSTFWGYRSNRIALDELLASVQESTFGNKE